MAARLRLYAPPKESRDENWAEEPPTPEVLVRLGDLLPLLALAQRMNFTWLKDFLDDEVMVSQDLHEVMQVFRGSRPTSA
jgi:hypothetical protein